jgi:hypothetical protein
MTDELEDRPKAPDDVKVPPAGSDLPKRDDAQPSEDPEAEPAAGTEPEETP